VYLLEEYYLRHSVVDVPVVNYSRRTQTYLYDRTQRPPIRLLSIWTDDSGAGPPMFVVDECCPFHNSYKGMQGGIRSTGHFHVSKRHKWEWDEYEEFLLDWVCGLPDGVFALDQHRGAAMAFAVCFDGWISRHGNDALKESVAVLIDPHNDSRLRRVAGATFQKFLREHPHLQTVFTEAFCNEPIYGPWLTRLVNCRHEAWFRDYCEKL